VFAYIYGRTRDTRATEDLASEVFKRVLAKAYPLADEQAFATGLFTTAREVLASHLRRRSGAGAPHPQGADDDPLLKRPDLASILDHLRQFSQRQQDVIALKFDAELTNAQIAQVMRLSEGKVGVILYRTLRKLRKALEQDD